LLREEVAAAGTRFVVIDEVQKAPALWADDLIAL
jgi:hypothetical protein